MSSAGFSSLSPPIIGQSRSRQTTAKTELGSVSTEASNDNTVRAICEVVEPMGAEAYLYLRSGPNTFIARVSGHIHPKVNQDLDLVIDMNEAHFFDKTTEEAIV